MEMNRAELAAVDGVPAELLDASGRLVITPNFATLDGQRNVPADLLPGESLAAFLERHVPGIRSGAWSVMIGGATVPQAMWARTFPKHGMLIACRAMPGKQVIAIIAIAVLTFFSAGIAAGIYGAVGGTFVAASAGATLAAIQAGVVIAGTALINKVLAPKVPSMSGPAAARAIYSLNGQRNSVRPYQPIPTLWGEMRVTPDAASAAYTWFEGDEQYLSLILLGGVNVYSASDLTIGDTPFSGYTDVTVYYSGFPGMPSEEIPLFSNADIVTGAELENDGDWITRTSSPDAIALQFDFEGQLYDIGPKGNTLVNNVTVYVEQRLVGASDWLPALSETLTNATADVMRRTFTLQVAQGQYEVRVRLGAPTWDEGEGKDQCKIGWNVLRTIQPDPTDYSDWGRIGIKIKATGQISGSLDTVRATYRARPMPIWNGSAWATATTRDNGLSNPGAILLQTMRGVYANGELQFGFGLPDEQIDIEGLKAFMLHCTANGYTYDKWVTDAVSLGQFCQEVALAGMGEFSWTDGSRPTAVFVSSGQPLSGVANMATMLKASFEVSYSLSNAADGIEYQYLDRDRNWETQTLRVSAPGVTTMLNPARITGEGVTSEAHAAIMARYHLAQSLYQFKTISYTADIEHLDYRRLSLLSISHDLTQWGYGGRLVSAQTVAGKVVLQLDETVPPMPQAFIGVRLPGYRDYRVFAVEALTAASDQVTLADPWPAGLPLPGATEEDPAHDTLWCYDFKATPGYRVRVVSMEPEAALKGARISCVPEGPEFWDYVINGNYVPAPSGSSLTANLPVASDLRITRSRVKVGAGWEHELSATWDVTGNYDHAQVWAAPAGQPLVLIDSNVYGTRLAWRVPSDQTWSVEVRPFDGLGRMGTIASAIFTDPSVVVGAVVGLAAFVETNGVMLRWNTPQEVDAIDYSATRIRMGVAGGTWETATPVFEGKADTCNLGWLQAGTLMFYAAHVNSAGDTSLPVTTSLVILPPAQPIVTGNTWIDQVELSWTPSETTQPLRGYEVRMGPILADAQILTVADAIGYVYTPPAAGTHMFWVTAIDRGGNRSAAGYVELTTLPHIDEALEQLQEGLDDVTAGIINIDGQIAAINSQLADISGVLDWDPDQTYEDSELVKFDGGLYRSLQDANTGHSPATSPTWWAKIGDYASLGEAVGALAAQVNYHDTRITELGDDVEAQAASVTSLTAQVGANTASVSSVSSAVATLTGRVNASYTLSIAAGNKIAGFRVSTDGATSDFVILSDRFAWALPDGSGVKYPLVLGLINGVPSFGFAGNMYVDGTIQARMVGVDQLRAEHIRSSEIEARHLKVGSVTADKIAVGVGGNLLKNSAIVTTSAWSTYTATPGQISFERNLAGSDWKPPTENTLGVVQSTGPGGGGGIWFSDAACAGGGRLCFSASSAAHNCLTHVNMQFFDGNGAEVAPTDVSGDSTNSTHTGGKNLSGYKRIYQFATAPATAVTVRVWLSKGDTIAGNTYSNGWWIRPMLEEAGPHQTSPSAYQVAGVGTLIDENGLSVSRISAISEDMGIMVHGRMVSADGQMTIDLDNKVIEMAWGGRRVRIDTNGFAFGPTGGAPKLFYNAATDQLTLNGTFTADAIGAVNTINIAGQGATTMKQIRGGYGSPIYGGDAAENWITLLSEFVTLKTGGNGVVIFLTNYGGTTTGMPAPPVFRLWNDSTGQILKEWAGYEAGPTTGAWENDFTIIDYAPSIGSNTYTLRVRHRQQWALHRDFRFTLLASHR